MRNKLLIPFLLLFFGGAFSQTSNDKIIYLDSLGNYSNKTNYEYSWVITNYYSNQDFNEATQYYKSGKVKMRGVYSNKLHKENIKIVDKMPLKGIIEEFYENGNRKKTLNFIIKESEKTFEWEWYEDGGKKSIKEYSLNKEEYHSFYKFGTRLNTDYRLLQFWDKNGVQKVIDGNGEYENDDKFEYEKGKYVRGHKEGEWIGRDKEHNFTYAETYQEGKLISGTSIDSNKIQKHYTTIYNGYGSGKKMIKLLNDISQKLLSKDVNNENNFSTILVNVDKEGKLSSVQTSPDISEKLEKTIKKYHHKTPIVYRGIAIPYSYPLTWQNFPNINNNQTNTAFSSQKE